MPPPTMELRIILAYMCTTAGWGMDLHPSVGGSTAVGSQQHFSFKNDDVSDAIQAMGIHTSLL
eukprot:8571030-Ditylum_brightwellii.AAC.1